MLKYKVVEGRLKIVEEHDYKDGKLRISKYEP
jgi:hypothetical protein